MAFTVITVTGNYATPTGDEVMGTVEFQLSADITNTDQTVAPEPEAVVLIRGAFSIDLVANNDPGTEPGDTLYTVTERIAGAPDRTYSIVVPYDAPGGTAAVTSLIAA